MMTTFVPTANQGLSVKFRNFFKPRDIFLHDGKSLRRFTIGAKLQMAVVGALAALLIWSVAATIAAVNAMSGDVARMQQQVAQMETDVAGDARRRTCPRHPARAAHRLPDHDAVPRSRARPELSQQLPRNVETPDNAQAAALVQGFARVDALQTAMADRVEAMTRQRYNAARRRAARPRLQPGPLPRLYRPGRPA